MNHDASDIGKDEPDDTTLSWEQLWMLPLILFHVICEMFSSHVDHFKHLRRTRPMPKGWEQLIEPLQEAEWPVFSARAGGARRILAGEPLDMMSIPWTDPDPGQAWLQPRSAQAMHLRMLDVFRFTSNPEFYIRRHAARIAKREAARANVRSDRSNAVFSARSALPSNHGERRRLGAIWSSGPNRGANAPAGAGLTALPTPARHRAGLRVRAPPWLARIPGTQAHPNSRLPPQRPHPHAQPAPELTHKRGPILPPPPIRAGCPPPGLAR